MSTKIEIRFIQKPFFIISLMVKSLDPNTTALGGVATGSINAQEAATVAPISKKYGWIFITDESETKTGSIIAVVAKLEVISVRKLTEAIRIRRSKIKGNASR